MRRRPIPWAVPLACLLAIAAAQRGTGQEKLNRWTIEVQGDWKAPNEDIQRVLDSAAEQLSRHCPERKLNKIIVTPGDGLPISLFKKGPNDEYQIRLTARQLFWAQYTYQFSHELGHVLCNYHKSPIDGKNHWFEESICETSSLFVLGQMSKAWAKEPPYPNWKAFAPNFERYVNDILAKRDRRLPPDLTMPQWLQKHLPELTKETGSSGRGRMVAAYLLPLFEDEPAGWEALTWINLGPRDPAVDFPSYLEGWHGRVPPKHQAFVGKIMQLFGYSARGKD